MRGADWVLHIDADEYLNVEIGDRRVDDLIALFPHADTIALQWRHFGSAGLTRWQGGSVVETFTRCEREVPVPGDGAEIGFKTLFRPHKFRMMGVHTPKKTWRNRVPVAVNAAGTPMPVDAMMTKRNSGYPVQAAHCTWDNACLHHHHVKSDDLHWLKHARGDANGKVNTKRLIGSEHYHLVNRNEVEDRSLVALRPRVAVIEAQMRALPQVAALEAAAMDWFRDRFQLSGQVAAMADQEAVAQGWLRERLTEIRKASGAAKFESRATRWFLQMVARLEETEAADREMAAAGAATGGG